MGSGDVYDIEMTVKHENEVLLNKLLARTKVQSLCDTLSTRTVIYGLPSDSRLASKEKFFLFKLTYVDFQNIERKLCFNLLWPTKQWSTSPPIKK